MRQPIWFLFLSMFIALVSPGCGGPSGEGQPGSSCSVAGDCGCFDCACTDGTSPTVTTANGRVCDTSSKTCLDADDACNIICGEINQTSSSSAPGTDCSAP